ncbi:MAG: YebC/PmpR family DNA-binding transcriptional regulator [Patescibacteria group bacterium]
MSGHSRWTQIKHKKGAVDAKRGLVFGKLIREITVAAREAGTNPDANARLRAAMERGREAGLPKDNIARALERASGKGAGGELFEFLYEAVVPHGVSILIEGITDSKNRTLAEIKHLLNERGCRLAEPGSLSWNFERVGTLMIRTPTTGTITREDVEAAIIGSGASDFRAEDGDWLVETPAAERERVRAALEAGGVAVAQAEHDYKPRAPLTLGPEERTALDPLLDALTDHPDVLEVYTNLRE